MWLFLAALAGCTMAVIDLPGQDTGLVETDTEDDGCDVVELDIMGPDEPHPGDSWTVWLRCDGATLLGPTVLQFDPTDFATIDDNVATFQYAGTAEMRMQVGSIRETMDVTVVD